MSRIRGTRSLMTAGALALAVLVSAGEAGARLNPLNVITSGVKNPRAEIIIVLDNSSKMIEPTGAGCSGIQPGFDYCGDGACSGPEGTGLNSCDEDCNEGNAAAMRPPNFIANCVKNMKSDDTAGNFYMLKRAMRNVVPEFRTVATFALDTYPRSKGYYPYIKADYGGDTPEAVSILLHHLELKHSTWIYSGISSGDTGWDATKDAPSERFQVRGIEYKRLDMAAAAGWKVDASGGGTVISGPDSVYRRVEGTAYLDKRFPFSGHQFNDGTHNWEYVGTYYTFMQPDIKWYEEGKWTDVAASSDGKILDLIGGAKYLGPMFDDGSDKWVYHKFRYNDALLGMDPTSPSVETGYVWPELYLETSSDQTAHDKKIAALLQWLGEPWNGGASTDQQGNASPAKDGIDKAREHFEHRINGTGPFASVGPDGPSNCRNRFVLFLTHGKYSPSGGANHPMAGIKTLYDLDAANPIKTYVIGMYPEDLGVIEQSADMGDDGQLNSSITAMTGNNEAELTDALRTTLVNALQGDFTTAAPGVTTISSGSGGVTVVDNVTLLPSTEFPGWKGHVRAVDLAQTPAQVLWDAGAQLQSRDWKNRAIFTGSPSVDGGTPVRLVATDGTINLAGDDELGSAKFGTNYGIKDIWPHSITCSSHADCPHLTLCGGDGGWVPGVCAPSNNDFVGLVEWIAGKGRPDDWKLGPVVASVPATVGPPPEYAGVTDGTVTHSTFEAARENRPRISYVLSNEGGLHAFSTDSGNELFFYLVPESLWRLFDLYRQGGQDEDPRNFKYVLAASARVEDFPDSSTVDGFRTQLILTMGPGGNTFVVLDVNQPIDCASCALNNPPFKLVAHSNILGVAAQALTWAHGSSSVAASSLFRYLGETWSLPSVFYDYDSGTLKAHAAMGSGYWDGYDTSYLKTSYYHYLKGDPAPEMMSMLLDMNTTTSALPCAPVVGDYNTCHQGVVANAIAVVDENAKRQVIATYQADLAGRLVRFDKGVPDITATGTTAKELLASEYTTAGFTQRNHPLHFAPAAFLEGTLASPDVVVAFNSLAFTEDQWDFDPATSLPAPPATSVIGMLKENSGAVAVSKLCKIDTICSCLPLSPTFSAPCVGPSANALPTSQPLLLQNTSAGNRMEAFFLYYDPPPPSLNSCGDRIGDTWSIRMTLQGSVFQLQEAKKIPDTYGSGLTIIGRGKDLGVALTGVGKGAQATVSTHSGNPLGSGLGIGDVVSEGIREVN